MISKRKQNLQVEMKFDPGIVSLVQDVRKNNPDKYFEVLDQHTQNMSIAVKNDQMEFGSVIHCTFEPVKDFNEAQTRIENLRKFAKKLKSKCYEPTSVFVMNGKDLYMATLMAPDYGRRGR